MSYVYLLEDLRENKTYIGFSHDVEKRLLQHNGVLSGGARATKGGCWKRICYISGFPDDRSALQFEWAWKFYSKKQSGSPLRKRMKALLELLGCEQITSKAKNYLSYVKNLQVIWEDTKELMYYL
jgi:structure-specific endonuclease subunit SLX1